MNSNGLNSYLILDSLADGSKYGLEIIEHISQKTGGQIILKKPSLYSSLTRMEKKGLISSSFWGESEIGGKRHYYTITALGKEELKNLSTEFENENFSASDQTVKDDGVFLDANETLDTQNASIEEHTDKVDKTDENQEEKPVFLQQNNMFDSITTPAQSDDDDDEEDDVIENQMDIFSIPPQNTVEEKIEDEPAQNDSTIQEKLDYYQSILESAPEKSQDDGKLLDEADRVDLQEQNKRLYDTALELKKYRKKKSFSENQIEMSVVYEKEEDKQIQKDRIEQLKQSMLNAKQNAYAQVVEPEKDFVTLPSYDQSRPVVTNTPVETKKEKVEEKPDDGVFITGPRIETHQIPVQKKITPPNIDVNIYDDNLPAPKRDANLEPTYKDMMAKLFERKKETQNKPAQTQRVFEEPQQEVSNFADYDSLKKYYAGHNIEFKEYKKSTTTRVHNTNLLNFIISTFLLAFSGIGCGIFFAIGRASENLKPATNFMYYTLPILFFVYSIYALIKYKTSPSKKPALIYNSVINWAVFVFAVVIVFVINIACGMQFESMATYLTSWLVPIFGLLLVFPINYYLKWFAYKKFGK